MPSYSTIMRRSNAPSNTNEPAKRAKFATPWAKQRENNEQCEIVTKTKVKIYHV